MHYVFDKWMQHHHASTPWCRYADDGLVHCETEKQAQELLRALRIRFVECGLEVHPEKTKIVYCKDGRRRGRYPNTSFDFLGYTFRARAVSDKHGKMFTGFNPAVSKTALKSMRATTRKLNWRNRADLSLKEIARQYNPVLQGWLNYYGRHYRSELYPLWRHFNKTLVCWAMRKYKPLRKRKKKAVIFLEKIAEREPGLFVHWRNGMVGAFA